MSNTTSVSFSVDATHIDRLGRELVARQDTALAELIKNAYDADATELLVTFFPESAERVARIEIEDNGNGMTIDDVIGGFMRISTSEKVQNPTSPRFKRVRAGRKGIGRFAAQRLARKLIVITRSRIDETQSALRLEFDWDSFTANRDIQDIQMPITALQSAPFGTRLILEDLRDHWTDNDVEEVSDSLAPLIEPKIGLEDPASNEQNSFTFTFVGPKGENYTPRDAFLALSKQSIAVINASLDSDGIPILAISSPRFPEVNGKVRLFDEAKTALRGVSLNAYYYIQAKDLLPGVPEQRRTVRDALRRYGGIRIYRNGFRVMPYGEPANDWAELDAEYRKRSTLLAPIGNQNFIGIVTITDPDGDLFQETSSREGMIENWAFRELRQFVFRACYETVRSISAARATQSTQVGRKASAGIKYQVSEFRTQLGLFEKATTEEEKTSFARALADIGRNIAKSATVLEATRIEEINMLRILSTLGMTVAEFVHEVRGTISYANGDLRDILDGNFQEPTKSRLARLKSNLTVLSRYTDYFSAVITSNESLSVRPVSMDRVLATFQQFAAAIVEPRNIKLDVKVEGYGVKSKPMHEAEWLSILSNFLSNSVKALNSVPEIEPKIQIRALKNSADVIVRFSDNGVGIPVENWGRVFDAFFTTTRPDLPRSRGNADSASGMGLGLKIVRDIVESNNGVVSVVSAPPGYHTCFEVRLPGAWEVK